MKLIKGLMTLAEAYSRFSDDAETKVGCFLINRETRKVTVSGTNAFIEGTKGLPNKRPAKYQYIQHAEAAMVYYAAKQGVSTNNSILICTHSPCMNCVRLLFQAGVNTIYFKHVRKDLDNINYVLDLQGKLVKLKSGFYKLKLSVRK